MNPLAVELNSVLDGTIAGRLLSPAGKRLYFPKGIIAQSTEAKKSAYTANATIGTAYENGKPLILSAVRESMPGLTPEQAVAYAPTAGVDQLRADWKALMLRKNPSLKPEQVSLPAVVPGLTAGLALTADLFLPEDACLLASDPCWDNYSLVFEERRNARIRGIPFFGKGPGLDLDAIGSAIREEAARGVVRVILNFPNNPSGYSPTRDEARALAGFFLDAANQGADVLVICDDAYFGHFYEEGLFEESMFSLLAGLHRNILAVKIDGPIKEYYVWGLRTGFVSFGSKGLDAAACAALGTKFAGAVRSSVSCANTPAQHIIMKTLADSRTAEEKARFQETLKTRYLLIKDFIKRNGPNPALTPLPFNSGYFMSFRCEGISAETLRKELLAKHGIGVVALGESCLRVAFSSLDEPQIEPVYRAIYDSAAELKQRSS